MKPLIVVALLCFALVLGWLMLPVPDSNGSVVARAGNVVSAPPMSDFTLRAERVFTGSEWLSLGLVEVREGRITRVGSEFDPASDIPLMDLGDRTLLPGLIDAHVHIWGEGVMDALQFGVTTVLDQANDAGQIARLQAGQRGAEVFSSGPPATAPGGHGTQFGYTPPPVNGPDDAEGFVRQLIDSGSDWMKIIVETGGGNWAPPSLDQETAVALTRAALDADLLPVAHVSSEEHARWVLEAGVAGLVHVYADKAADTELVARMAEQGAFVIPTLVVLNSATGQDDQAWLEDGRVAPWLTSNQLSSLNQRFFAWHSEAAWQRALGNTRAMHAAGIDILAGSDATNPGTAHGVSLHRELQLLVQAGLEPTEALAAATHLPARHFGLDDRGLLEAGRRADLLVVDGDPGQDIAATLAIHAIWQAGQPIERQERAEVKAASAVPSHGRLSAFTADEAGTEFGFGWMPIDDETAGGDSSVTMTSQADDTRAWIRLEGEIGGGFAWPWAGAMVFPGEQPMEPADLSAFQTLRFTARGQPSGLRVMVFSPSLGTMPATQEVSISADWQTFEVALSDFAGADLDAIMGVAFVAGSELGTYAFDLADVVLE